jgi:threonine synthase
MLTSANSINIGRLLPQSLYYFEAYAQIGKSQQEVSFIVPSGNLGNITSGIIAKFMGLPVWHFIAAVNNNKVFMEYLNKSVFTPASTIQTLSNAMDVGNPSNIHRLISLFHGDIESIRKAIAAFSVEDDETLTLIKSFFDRFGYVIDPHTAVGYGAFLKSGQKSDEMNILLSTAHYGKFLDVVERVIEKKYLHLPSELEIQLHKEKQAVLIPAEYSILREILLSVSA